MYFAQFYTKGVSENLIEACGDRGVYKLDGRNSMSEMIQDSIVWARRHGFGAFKICRGDSFIDSLSLTTMIYIRSRLYEIDSTLSKVDFSPSATSYLQGIIEDSNPDSFTQDQRDYAVYLAKRYGHETQWSTD